MDTVGGAGQIQQLVISVAAVMLCLERAPIGGTVELAGAPNAAGSLDPHGFGRSRLQAFSLATAYWRALL